MHSDQEATIRMEHRTKWSTPNSPYLFNLDARYVKRNDRSKEMELELRCLEETSKSSDMLMILL